MRISDWSSDVCSSDLRLLEHHADLAAQAVHRIARVEDVLAVEQDRAGGPQLGVDGVDAVEDAQQGGLAATGRSEERRVGKECDSTCRSRWRTVYQKKT